MQHTLRDFVQGDPALRQQYFERLLHLGEVTELIQHAVMTDGPVRSIPNPKGGKHLQLWIKLGSILQNNSSQKAHSQRMKDGIGETFEEFLIALTSISRIEIPSVLSGLDKEEEIVATLQMEQMRIREDSFPILAQLRPRMELLDRPQESQPAENVESLGQKIRDMWKKYGPILLAIQKMEDNNRVIAKVYKELLDSGIIQPERDSQTCPLCFYEHAETLSAHRISTIEKWSPIHDSAQAIEQELDIAVKSLLDVLSQMLDDFDNFLPTPPTDSRVGQVSSDGQR